MTTIKETENRIECIKTFRRTAFAFFVVGVLFLVPPLFYMGLVIVTFVCVISCILASIKFFREKEADFLHRNHRKCRRYFIGITGTYALVHLFLLPGSFFMPYGVSLLPTAIYGVFTLVLYKKMKKNQKKLETELKGYGKEGKKDCCQKQD